MVDNIRATFRTMLEEVDWMDERTRTKALEKADKITPHIAYAEEILDDSLLTEYYEGLELSDESFLKNILRLNKHINLYYAKQFRQPIIRDDWRTHGGAAVVNAFYSRSENSIQVKQASTGFSFLAKVKGSPPK